MSPYEKPPKKDDIDDFWNIADMLPERKKSKMPPPRFADTEAVTVSTGATAWADGAKIPPRGTAPKAEAPKKIDYKPESDFLRRVTITPWPADFNFYQKFRSDAVRYFERTHAPCEYVYFFSYMPQYDQMTVSQMAYYLYWRAEFKKGNEIKADNSYILLFAYEIINLPDKIPPKEGAQLLARLWRRYREDYNYFDKYFGEWLCDYCLIHRVVPSAQILSAFLPDALENVSVPEFYLQREAMSPALIAAICAYDYRKSKYYEANQKAYDTHMPRALSRVVERVILRDLEKYGLHPTRLVRDSFSGAVVCRREKYKIEILCCPLRRSYEFRQLLSRVAKLCENQLRAAFGIKSRFNPTGLDADVKRAVDEYFNEYYPDRAASSKKRQAEVDESYMALYEPENKGPADITRALAIEAAAWETAELLETETEDAVETPAPFIAPVDLTPSHAETEISFDLLPTVSSEGGDFDFLLDMEVRLFDAVRAAEKGSFAAYCREIGTMPDRLAGEINELAMDAMGDIIIDEDYSLVPDYADEITEVLRLKEE